jgi:hypothetical protein
MNPSALLRERKPEQLNENRGKIELGKRLWRRVAFGEKMRKPLRCTRTAPLRAESRTQTLAHLNGPGGAEARREKKIEAGARDSAVAAHFWGRRDSTLAHDE